ncbi:hypothetical protein ONJ45_27090, partial [Salmonella enterica subsp. enterica serovar Virginia]|nr:hypothetical protein [Salmonella enterica subsp. enterica serovar Virginia]
ADDMKFFAERVDKDAIARLERFVSTDFAQVDYTDAVAILERCSAFYEAIAAGVREGVDCRDPIPYVKKQLEELKGKVDLTVLLA